MATPEGEVTIGNDFVLAMTGYNPDFEMIRSLGMEFQDDAFETPVYDPETHETNVEGLYLIGVICGGLNTSKWFIENSRDHADRAAAHIAAAKK